MSPADQPKVVRHRAIRYCIGLVSAHLLTAAELVGVLGSLRRQTLVGTESLLTTTNLFSVIVLIIASSAVVGYGGYRIFAPSVRWFDAGTEPDATRRRAAINIIRRQSILLLAVWLVSGAVFLLANRGLGAPLVALMTLTVVFGGTATVSSSLLFTQRVIRPVVAAATREFENRITAPGVTARLVLMWTLTTALPSGTIAILVLCRMNGWIIPPSASIDIPVLLLALVAVFLGLRTLILVSLSISDPLREIIDAMADVEKGRIDIQVAEYEQSEIGRLQRGFNRMVTGLQERDRLRDLFGRHVGDDVMRLAVQTDIASDIALSGEVRAVAVLFIDVTGSTDLAMNHPPQEVAAVLNEFFRSVVAAVDEHHGLINKFQGDAALAVFGAPIAAEDAAARALATARSLGTTLRGVLDFGIGVSAGPVFAGNIGAENRYEYTVIGDPVNEAARLADTAKALPGRVACAGVAVDRADAEAARWLAHGTVTLRGRFEPTRVYVPR
ncbi:adenylate/guanylate cyclase domain-containing protein [Mycobacterium sp. C31M]